MQQIYNGQNGMEKINYYYIISPFIASVALIASIYAVWLNKRTLEITLYKNISDAIKNFLEFASKKSSLIPLNSVDDKQTKEFENIKRLFKQEVLNHLEYACKRYLDGAVGRDSFEEYYKHIVNKWAPKVHEVINDNELAFNQEDGVYQNIKRVHRIFNGTEAKPWKKRQDILFLIVIIISYIIMVNLWAYIS